jgi:hypothetical protein
MEEETKATAADTVSDSAETAVDSSEQPKAIEPTPALSDVDLASLRNASNQDLQEIIKTQKPLAENGDEVAGLWLSAATREHVEIRGIPLPVEEPATQPEG